MFGRPEEQTSEVQTELDSGSRQNPREGRILLVEDSAANQMVVEALLDHLGYTVDVANNGLEAVASVQTNHYDLILMDLAMPEMDGFEATQVIRGMDSRSAETPIVALTADAFTADHQRLVSP